MPLQDPVAVYNAESNVEAIQVCNALVAEGIEAHVTEDDSAVGLSIYGRLAEIHKPQVWVAREDVERARPVLIDFERRAAELRAGAVGKGEPIEVVCACGRTTTFPGTQRGSVQECPACGAFLDVGEPDDSEDWGSPEDEEQAEEKDEEDTP
jgi:hypothetical protein